MSNHIGTANPAQTIEQVSNQLMEEVKRLYAETGKLSDDLLSSLNFVFQGPLLSALELVDKRSVTHITSPSGRSLYQIIGASGNPYTCFPNLTYCSCMAYQFSVLRKEDHIMCKHVLAMKLSEAMGVCMNLEVSDAEVTNMIVSME